MVSARRAKPERSGGPAGAGPIVPVYGVFGADPFQREDFIRRLRGRVLPERESIHYESYPAAGGMRDVLNAAETLPFGGARKMVVARDCEEAPEETLPLLERYLARPNPTTVLVLEGAKSPGRKVTQLLKQSGELVAADPLKPHQVLDWLVRRAREAGRTLEREAALLIADRAGTDLALAGQELEKVLIFTPDPVIRREAAAGTLSGGGGGEVWALFDRIGERNLAGAFAALSKLLSQGDHPLKIVTQLANRLRRLYAFRRILAQGEPESEAGSRLGIKHPYALRCFSREAGAYTEAEIRQGLARLGEIDRKLKQTQLPGRILLEMFLVGFCSDRKDRRGGATAPSPASYSGGRFSGKRSVGG